MPTWMHEICAPVAPDVDLDQRSIAAFLWTRFVYPLRLSLGTFRMVIGSTKVEMIINLKTAKVLGVTVPLSRLGRADQIIE
jgi:hypothetical protein